MNNSKRNVHNSGPLGMLVNSGQVKSVEEDEVLVAAEPQSEQNRGGSSYFRTQAGLEFTENELVLVDPKECEPWKYANRQDDELGEIDQLIESIKENRQLQPALIRPHPNPHDGIKYEIIFGRRRHLACLKLGIPFLVIKKKIRDIQEAVASQDAENKYRKNVSNYSNALLYKRLLSDGVFPTEKSLADKVGMSISTFNDLMAYARIPGDIVKAIPDIHNLSNSMVLKIVALIKKSSPLEKAIHGLAAQIGLTISSPAKLEKALAGKTIPVLTSNGQDAKVILSKAGEKLFTFKRDQRGALCVVFNKKFDNIDHDGLCALLKGYLEQAVM